jgi:hypothetical protein
LCPQPRAARSRPGCFHIVPDMLSKVMHRQGKRCSGSARIPKVVNNFAANYIGGGEQLATSETRLVAPHPARVSRTITYSPSLNSGNVRLCRTGTRSSSGLRKDFQADRDGASREVEVRHHELSRSMAIRRREMDCIQRAGENGGAPGGQGVLAQILPTNLLAFSEIHLMPRRIE